MKLFAVALCVASALAANTHYDAPNQVCQHTTCTFSAGHPIQVTHKNSQAHGLAHHGPSSLHASCSGGTTIGGCGDSEAYDHKCTVTAGVCTCTCGEACRDSYERCGGGDQYLGPTCCKRGLTCMKKHDTYSQCRPEGTEGDLPDDWQAKPTTTTTTTVPAPVCGGEGDRCHGNPANFGTTWTVDCCNEGLTCFKKTNGPNFYGQCKPNGWTVPEDWVDHPCADAGQRCHGNPATYTGKNCCKSGHRCFKKTDGPNFWGKCAANDWNVPADWVDQTCAPLNGQCGGHPVAYTGTKCCQVGECVEKTTGGYAQCKPVGWTAPADWDGTIIAGRGAL